MNDALAVLGPAIGVVVGFVLGVYKTRSTYRDVLRRFGDDANVIDFTRARRR